MLCEINRMASSMLFFNHGDFTDDLSSAAFVCCEYITISRNENNHCYFLQKICIFLSLPIIKLASIVLISYLLCDNSTINWHWSFSFQATDTFSLQEFSKNARLRSLYYVNYYPPDTSRRHGSWTRMRANPAPPLTWLFEFFRCSSKRRQETAQSVLREQESLLSALQPRLHPEEEHDAAPAPRVRHGAQVPVSLLRQALQVYPEHLRAHPKVSSRSGIMLQALVLNNPIETFSSTVRARLCHNAARVIISLFFVRFRSISRPLSMLRK